MKSCISGSSSPPRLRQVLLATNNVGTMKAFYRDVVGLTPVFINTGPALALFDLGDVQLVLTSPGTPVPEQRASVLYYEVRDIETAHAAIKRRGAREVRVPSLEAGLPDHEVWVSYFRDPDGNLFSLLEERVLHPRT